MTRSSISRTSCGPFERSARHYDVLHAGKDYDHEAGIVLHHLAPKRDSVLLELGCGTGQFARRLARHVGRVIGLDPSAEMLACAVEAGPPDNCLFFQGGFSSIDGVARREHVVFGGACCQFGAMSYATADRTEQLVENLSWLRSWLYWGSPVVFDVLNVACCAHSLREQLTTSVEMSGGGRLTRKIAKRFEVDRSLVRHEIEFRIEGGPQDGDQWAEQHVMRAFTPQEVRYAMLRAGFGHVLTFPGPDNHANETGEITVSDYYFWTVGRAV